MTNTSAVDIKGLSILFQLCYKEIFSDVFNYLITHSVCVSVCSQNSLKEEEKKDDVIHIGNSIMTFYAALIDLLGRCAPEKHVRS